MRKTKTFEIEGIDKTILVNELTVRQIIDLMSSEDGEELGATDLGALRKHFEAKLLPIATNLTMEELLKMAPSEIQTVYENFKEVNQSFFDLARAAGLESVFNSLKQAITKDFGNLLVSSSNPAT
jgi:hypothetical protein